MPEDAKDPREAVALFRFGLIAPVLHLAPGPERAAALQQIADREHAIPGSRRRRVAVSTLQTWRRRHQQGGFQALHPKRRSDRNQPRHLPPEVAALLTAIKEREPRLTVKAVIRQAHDSGRVPDGLRLALSTVNRLLKQAGLMERPAEQPAGGDLRRYQWRFANDLWQADALHGPKIAAAEPGRRQAKVYLLATLDDATRVVPHAAFAYSENADNFLAVFRQAVLKRGVPQRLYCDNGSTFRSQQLELVCAQLGTCLVHARAYHPAGKGKIERFFRRVRAELLPTLRPEDYASLAALNRRLAAWIEGEYHHAPHHGLAGDTPLDRWAQVGGHVRFAGPGIDLRWIFSYRFVRRVSRARTVNLHGRQYETVAGLAGQKVTLVVEPDAPPERALTVLHEDGESSQATLVDLQVNARARRSQPPAGDPPKPPARPATPDRDQRPAPAKQQLRLRQLAGPASDPKDKP